jgi:hypothetical protein
MVSNTLEKISFWSLFLVVVLLPIFFLPFAEVPVETGKGLLLIVGLAVSLIFWLAARFSDGKITLPRSSLLVATGGIVVSFLAAAIFSPVRTVSFFGQMLDFGTFWFILAAALLMLVSSLVLGEAKRAKTVLLGVVSSFVVLFIFQVLRMFFPQTLSLGILSAKTDNILGSWNSLGLFAGFIATVALFLVEFFSISKLFKWLLGIIIAMSLLFVVLVNFPLIWGIVGVFALLIFVYKISFFSAGKQSDTQSPYFPSFSLAVIMISLFFFMAWQFVGTFIPSRMGLSNVEVSPSLSATLSVMRNTLYHSPVIGSGPNRFGEMWAMYKPLAINSTIFWDTSFASGSGSLPTFAVTTGALGILAWVVFLILFLSTGIKSLWSSVKKGISIELALFFLAALYLLVCSIMYSSGSVIFLLGFAFTGVFIGLSSSGAEEGKGHVSFSFMTHPKRSFFFILAVVFLMVLTAAMSFTYIERFVSVPYFGRAISASSIPVAEADIIKATSFYTNDLYLRTYSQVYLAKMNSIIAKGSNLSDSDKSDLQASFNQAVQAAQLATQYDKTSYLNYRMLGSVYELVAPLGVTGAYDKAIQAYNQASTLDPLNPGIKLDIGRSYFENSDTANAKTYVNQAISLKGDYTNALLTMSQIAKSEGDTASALTYAQQALSTDPTNTSLVQYVNSLRGGTQ